MFNTSAIRVCHAIRGAILNRSTTAGAEGFVVFACCLPPSERSAYPVPNRQSNLLARIPTSNNEDRSNTVPVTAQIREVSPNVQSVQLSLVEDTGSRHTHALRSATRTAPNVGTEGKQNDRPSLWNIPDINVERMNERNSEQGSCPIYLTRLSLPSKLHQFTTLTGGLGD